MGLTWLPSGVGRAVFLPGGSEGSRFLFQLPEAAHIRDPLAPSLKAAMFHLSESSQNFEPILL